MSLLNFKSGQIGHCLFVIYNSIVNKFFSANYLTHYFRGQTVGFTNPMLELYSNYRAAVATALVRAFYEVR